MDTKKIYTSGAAPKSAVKRQGFTGYMSSLFGWKARPDTSSKGLGASSSQIPVDFVKVDVSSKQRVTQAALEQALNNTKLSEKLEALFNSWLSDTTDSLTEISNRFKRVDQLTYAKLNDPFIGRVVKLYADEGSQLDVQDHLIGVETPDPLMTKEMYSLLNLWGVTQPRVRAALEQMATYGDAFWANKISERGVERIIPLKQLQISDRLEFNPVEALEKLKRRQGGLATLADRHALIKTMIEDMADTGDFADLFDTKLFGYAIQNDLVVPPWSVTHFRVDADASEFTPFGVSPILNTLAPFKLTASTITLQSIARVLSFPVTLYKVKTSLGTDEGRQLQTVNRVREAYDNIGVTPAAGNSEVYTVNTKIWMPDGLMDVDVKASQVDIGFTNDIELYQDRTAVATGVPKGYLVQEWGGFGNSAISLTEQFKPFARAVYSLQSAFLEGLSELFRLHFAITGRFDFRTPFTLSLKFPAEEVSDEKRASRTGSLELAGAVLEMIRAAIGAQEDEGLPPDIVRDIISKYTFLDPVDVVRWTRDAQYGGSADSGRSSGSGSGSGGSSGGDSGEFDLEKELSDIEGAAEEPAATPEEESFSSTDLDNADFSESYDPIEASRIRESRSRRLRELTSRYVESKDVVYFNILRENTIFEFVRDKAHVFASFTIPSSMQPMYEALNANTKTSGAGKKRLSEKTIAQALQDTKDANDPENAGKSSEESSS